ncbi:hypothetical protein GMRT_13595 [Giardia muris]|uniref:Uncharacterized protein n=1 Tax=Giardia muris TaxID=5742 RepID=A0A4Z1SZ21_GIAMU|nr:hypothetical protein GMRT_13595 [Giardia muris]|eukprot:TNJ30015.1 hypothetical protein GMRT_13595 [Giardia muris]
MEIASVSEQLTASTGDLIEALLAITDKVRIDTQKLTSDTIHVATRVVSLGDEAMSIMDRGRMAFDAINQARQHPQIVTTDDEKAMVLAAITAALEFVEQGTRLQADLVEACLGHNAVFTAQTMKGIEEYDHARSAYLETYPDFDTLSVVADTHKAVQLAREKFLDSMLQSVLISLQKAFAATVARRPTRELKNTEHYIDIQLILDSMRESKPLIQNLFELDVEKFRTLRALYIIVFCAIVKESTSHLVANIGGGVEDPTLDILRGLQLKSFQLSYNSLRFPNGNPIAAPSVQGTSGRQAAMQVPALTHSSFSTDKALGHFLLCFLETVLSVEKMFAEVFYPLESGVTIVSSYRTCNDPVLLLPMASVENLNGAIANLTATSQLLSPDLDLGACIGTIFVSLCDLSVLKKHHEYVLGLQFLPTPCYLQTVRNLSSVSSSTNVQDVSVVGRPLTQILDVALSQNVLYSFAFLAEVVEALLLARYFRSELYLIILSVVMVHLNTRIDEFCVTFYKSLSDVHPSIKQAGVFSGTLHTCILLTAIYSLYFAASYTARSLRTAFGIYEHVYARLIGMLGSSGAELTTVDIEQVEHHLLTPVPDLEEFTAIFTLHYPLVHIEKAVKQPYGTIITKLQEWLEYVVKADRGNTEKYGVVATLENLSFLCFYCSEILTANFKTSLNAQLADQCRQLLSEYIAQNMEYKFSGSNSWVVFYDAICSALNEGLQFTEIPTRPGLTVKDADAAIKNCNSTLEKSIHEVLERFLKHLNTRSATNAATKIVSLDRLQQGTSKLCERVFTAFRDLVLEKYSNMLSYLPKCYSTGLKAKPNLTSEKLTMIFNSAIEGALMKTRA